MTVCMCILQSNQGLVCFRALLVTFQGSYGPISVVHHGQLVNYFRLHSVTFQAMVTTYGW